MTLLNVQAHLFVDVTILCNSAIDHFNGALRITIAVDHVHELAFVERLIVFWRSTRAGRPISPNPLICRRIFMHIKPAETQKRFKIHTHFFVRWDIGKRTRRSLKTVSIGLKLPASKKLRTSPGCSKSASTCPPRSAPYRGAPSSKEICWISCQMRR